MCRLTVDGEIRQFSCKMDVPPHMWDTKTGRAAGRSATARIINEEVDRIRADINRHYLELIRKDGYVNSLENVDRGYLSLEEIRTMINTGMPGRTHELVRDLFIFSTFTGLAYSDVKSLTYDNIQTFFDGNLWIIKRRKKTNTESNIRLLEIPKRIIEKYRGISGDNHVFPVPSNTTCNKILKDIASLCGINRKPETN